MSDEEVTSPDDNGYSYFSDSYASARRKFRALVAKIPTATLIVQTLQNGQLKGPHGEDLSIDIAIIQGQKDGENQSGTRNDQHPKRILVHSSGTHGVEGFAGSAIQLKLLHHWKTHIEQKISADDTIIFVHAVNPYGMAWRRRWNENNADINRNCILVPNTLLSDDQRFEELAKSPPEDYKMLYKLINPQKRVGWTDMYYAKAAYYIWRYGLARLKQACAGGQYYDANGIYFGGNTLQESPRHVLKTLFEAGLSPENENLETFIHIDVHTGLGPRGVDTLLGRTDPTKLRRIAHFESDESLSVARRRVQNNQDGADSGIAYMTEGEFVEATRQLSHYTSANSKPSSRGSRSPSVSSKRRRSDAQAHETEGVTSSKAGRKCDTITFIQEFGTYAPATVFKALRAELAALREFPDLPFEAPERKDVLGVFYIDKPDWKESILDRGTTVFDQCMDYLKCQSDQSE